MRILMIGPGPRHSKGGMATVLGELAESPSLNHAFHIDVFESYRDGSRPAVLFFCLYAFLRFFISGRGYDIYHLHVASKGSTWRKRLYAGVIRRWKKKLILHIHSGRFIDYYREISARRQGKIRAFLEEADCVIALSEEWRIKLLDIAPHAKITVIENGVNTDLYDKAQSDIPRFSNAFLALSRMKKAKGTYDLINAAAAVKKTHPGVLVYLAGDGEIEEARSAVRHLGLEETVHVIGWADEAMRLSLLKKTATVVLPSYSEALPMSLLEGMASGKAVISTTVGAIPEVIKAENGILLPPGDVSALAQAMIRFMDHPEEITACARANRTLIKTKYSLTVMTGKIAGCYRAL